MGLSKTAIEAEIIGAKTVIKSCKDAIKVNQVVLKAFESELKKCIKTT